jgi:membrane-bound ClpP family serine protease
VELTWSGRALVVTLLFRSIFGGYLIGMDQYRFDDVDSASTVLLIYGLIGIFATLFLLGKRYGLLGIIGLDVIFIISQSFFTIAALSGTVDAGLHDPLTNWWATLLMFLFSILTLIFAFKIYRETGQKNPSCSEQEP